MIENFIFYVVDFLRFYIVNLGFGIEINFTSVKWNIYFSSVRGLACWWIVDLLTAVRIHVLPANSVDYLANLSLTVTD